MFVYFYLCVLLMSLTKVLKVRLLLPLCVADVSGLGTQSSFTSTSVCC